MHFWHKFPPSRDLVSETLLCSHVSTINLLQLFSIKLIGRSSAVRKSEVPNWVHALCASAQRSCSFCVPLTAPLWTLSTHCLTWPPPKVSWSWPSHRLKGEGVCVWVCGHMLGGLGGRHITLLGPGSSESCWLFLEGTQREFGWAGWTRAGCLSRSLASRWHQAGGERSSYFTLTRRSTPSTCSPGWHTAGSFLYWKRCQLWLWRALIT